MKSDYNLKMKMLFVVFWVIFYIKKEQYYIRKKEDLLEKESNLRKSLERRHC